MLEIRHLTKRFGTSLALDGVSLDVRSGEIVGLLGRNGAGKTTLLRIAAGFLAPTGGRVRVGGRDLFTDSLEARRLLGYLPEGCPLYEEPTVEEYLRFRGRLKGLAGRRLKRRVREIEDRCGLETLRHTHVARLSHGQRIRVGLADAVLHEPRLLILDEPLAGLDAVQIRETRALVAAVAGQAAVVLATHLLAEAEQFCTRFVMLDAGRIVASRNREDPPDSVARAVHLEIAGGDGLAAQQLIMAVPGVRRVQAERLTDDWWSLVCEFGSPADVREELATAVLRAGWRLRALDHAGDGITAWFHRVALQAGSAAAAVPPKEAPG